MGTHAIQMADGSLAIMQTVGEATVEACFAKWSPAEQAKVVSHKPIDPAAIPDDRAFRNAWILAGDKIEHDMTKARDILRDRIRTERVPLLAALDVDQTRALVAKDNVTVQAIELQKRALRDAPANPAIDAAATVNVLKAMTLKVLTDAKSPARVG